mmetsp:Transcript_7391/g.19937  ORF Transcript_7391/g.19937 Transcript_7391/m.19937 type:complete len:208 (+) Transcript_7391:1036-1659(+)
MPVAHERNLRRHSGPRGPPVPGREGGHGEPAVHVLPDVLRASQPFRRRAARRVHHRSGPPQRRPRRLRLQLLPVASGPPAQREAAARDARPGADVDVHPALPPAGGRQDAAGRPGEGAARGGELRRVRRAARDADRIGPHAAGERPRGLEQHGEDARGPGLAAALPHDLQGGGSLWSRAQVLAQRPQRPPGGLGRRPAQVLRSRSAG